MAGTITKRLQSTIEQSGLLRPGERVGVAVSGGADSIALLFLLFELRRSLGIVLNVVHFNHRLRGRSSDADERAVAKLAKELGLGFHVEREDIKAKARREKANLEDAGRRARYDFFAQLVADRHLDKIAVAHTADDQAETVLAHILRGTGLAGLGGIHPVVGHIVRPLLQFRRAELRAYLRSKKQAWREDGTNRDTTRLRARIRKKLLPLLEKQFQPEIVHHLAMLSNLAREDEAFLGAFAQQSFDRFVILENASATIPCHHLVPNSTSGEPILALSKRLIRLIVKRVKRAPGQFNAEHVDAVLKLANDGENGKLVQLPGGIVVRRMRDALIFSPAVRLQRAVRSPNPEFARVIGINGSETQIPVPELSCVFRFTVIDWPSERGDTIDKRSVLDRDALRSPLVLRSWRPGDRFRPIGHRNAHKLKQLLSKMHITGDQRRGWPVLTCGEEIAWCRALPVAAEFAANERTRTGLLIVEDRFEDSAS